MIKLHQALTFFVISSSLSLCTVASEHEMHQQGHEAPNYDCNTVNKMDHSKMDMNDPHMQNMMEACGAHGYKSEKQHGHDKRADKVAEPHNHGHSGHARSDHQ